MPDPWLQVLAFFAGAAVGGVALWLLLSSRLRLRRQRLEAEGEELKRRAEREGEQQRDAREQELRQMAAGLAEREEMLKRERSRLQESESGLKERTSGLQRREEEIEQSLHEARKKERLYRMRLHSMQDWDAERARKAAIEEARKECAREIQRMREDLLGTTEAEIEDEARKILLAAMQRLASNPANEVSATIVKLKNEHMKGRIIGREGRNIRSFESLTGTTIMIDETPDSVLISSFDPVRREVARMALDMLMKDGRINPATIEETVARCQDMMKRNLQEQGEQALRRLRLPFPGKEIVELLGKLHYRLSNNQNTLDHSIEVANISTLLAAELGLDREIAKRAGLYHDMGKAVSHEYEGSHAAAAADVLKRHGEDPRVINAVAAHHDEVPDQSVYAALIKVADSLSAMRPGARADSMDSYIRRVKSLEEVALGLPGVIEAYAIQAGREVRVVVSPETVSDTQARDLALLLRQRVEEELNFPGCIKITVIREQRFQETAK